MSVSYFMQEAHTAQDLFKVVLDHFDVNSFEIVDFEELIEWLTQWLEDKAEMLFMVEGMFVPYKASLVVAVSSVYAFNDLFLY